MRKNKLLDDMLHISDQLHMIEGMLRCNEIINAYDRLNELQEIADKHTYDQLAKENKEKLKDFVL